MAQVPQTPQTPRWDAIDLAPFLAQLGIDAPGAVVNARELSGGASKDLWLFEVEADGQTTPYVLRRAKQEATQSALDIAGEYVVLRAAFDAGVRAPQPFYQATDADGYAFFIMEYVEAETLAPRLFRREEYADTRGRMAADLGAFLAPVHRVPPDDALTAVLGPVPEGNTAALALQLYEAVYRDATRNPHPAFEVAFRYLAERIPEPTGICLVHGDYRLGNVMFGPEGLRAVLDWELAHWGDPLEDLGWLTVRAWRFGHDDLPVAGCGTRDELYAGYESAGGRPVDRDRVHWWEVFGNLRWGIITLGQAMHFVDGASRDLEKGAIGRRASEVEAELLNLIRD